MKVKIFNKSIGEFDDIIVSSDLHLNHEMLLKYRPFKSVVFRTAKQAKASLYYAGKEIPMYKLYKSGSLVKISVDKRYRNWFGFERGKDK